MLCKIVYSFKWAKKISPHFHLAPKSKWAKMVQIGPKVRSRAPGGSPDTLWLTLVGGFYNVVAIILFFQKESVTSVECRFKRIKIAQKVLRGRWSCTDSILTTQSDKSRTPLGEIKRVNKVGALFWGTSVTFFGRELHNFNWAFIGNKNLPLLIIAIKQLCSFKTPSYFLKTSWTAALALTLFTGHTFLTQK